MTILIEAINVVIKIDSLKREFGEDLDNFYDLIPNQTNYQDAKLLRVGFMVEKDLIDFIGVLENNRLNFLDQNQKMDDFAVIAQGFDLRYECEWLHLFSINYSEKDLEVAAYKDSSGVIYFEEDKNSFIRSDGWSVDDIKYSKNGAGKYLKTTVEGDGAIDIYIDAEGNYNNIGRKKKWFDLPFFCLLRMPLRLSLIMSIIGVIIVPLIAPPEDALSSKIVWGFFIGGFFGLVLSSQYAKEFPMTPAWVRRLLGG